MTEAEWAVCEPLLPAPAWLAGRGGRPASRCMRDIVDAIRYLTHNGPVWRALPADFPPAWTVYWWADKWQADGSAERMHDDLRDRVRAAAGRKAAPTAAIIDSQSVKGSEMIGRGRRGYDAGKKINGTRRHIAVDALGLLLTVLVTAASVQDRDAARPLLWNLRRAFPSVRLAWADGGYTGKLVTWARTRLKPKLTLEIVKRPDDLHLPGPAPPVGGRADAVLDHPPPPHRPRLRTPGRPPRDLHLLGHDHRHDPPPRPPARRLISSYLSSQAGS
jgi:transposase